MRDAYCGAGPLLPPRQHAASSLIQSSLPVGRNIYTADGRHASGAQSARLAQVDSPPMRGGPQRRVKPDLLTRLPSLCGAEAGTSLPRSMLSGGGGLASPGATHYAAALEPPASARADLRGGGGAGGGSGVPSAPYPPTPRPGLGGWAGAAGLVARAGTAVPALGGGGGRSNATAEALAAAEMMSGAEANPALERNCRYARGRRSSARFLVR